MVKIPKTPKLGNKDPSKFETLKDSLKERAKESFRSALAEQMGGVGKALGDTYFPPKDSTKKVEDELSKMQQTMKGSMGDLLKKALKETKQIKDQKIEVKKAPKGATLERQISVIQQITANTHKAIKVVNSNVSTVVRNQKITQGYLEDMNLANRRIEQKIDLLLRKRPEKDSSLGFMARVAGGGKDGKDGGDGLGLPFPFGKLPRIGTGGPDDRKKKKNNKRQKPKRQNRQQPRDSKGRFRKAPPKIPRLGKFGAGLGLAAGAASILGGLYNRWTMTDEEFNENEERVKQEWRDAGQDLKKKVSDPTRNTRVKNISELLKEAGATPGQVKSYDRKKGVVTLKDGRVLGGVNKMDVNASINNAAGVKSPAAVNVPVTPSQKKLETEAKERTKAQDKGVNVESKQGITLKSSGPKGTVLKADKIVFDAKQIQFTLDKVSAVNRSGVKISSNTKSVVPGSAGDSAAETAGSIKGGSVSGGGGGGGWFNSLRSLFGGGSGGGGGSGRGGGAGSSINGNVKPYTGSVSFNQLAPKWMRRLMSDFNLTKEQAAGILGNLGHESGGFKQLQEINPRGGGRGGLGYAQWTGIRRRRFEAFLQKNKMDVRDPEANYKFLKWELQNTHRRALTALRKTKDVKEAMFIFEKYYEAAGVKHYNSRMRYANQALQLFGSGAEKKEPEVGSQPGGPGDAPVATPAAAASGAGGPPAAGSGGAAGGGAGAGAGDAPSPGSQPGGPGDAPVGKPQDSAGGDKKAAGDGKAATGLNWRKGVDTRINEGIANKVKAIQSKAGISLELSSGYRDPKRNRRAGGAKNSAHTRANAVDTKFTGGIPATLNLIKVASELGIGGIGVYRPGSVHLDTEGRRAWGPTFRRASVPRWAEEAIRAHESGKMGAYDPSARGNAPSGGGSGGGGSGGGGAVAGGGGGGIFGSLASLFGGRKRGGAGESSGDRFSGRQRMKNTIGNITGTPKEMAIPPARPTSEELKKLGGTERVEKQINDAAKVDAPAPLSGLDNPVTKQNNDASLSTSQQVQTRSADLSLSKEVQKPQQTYYAGNADNNPTVLPQSAAAYGFDGGVMPAGGFMETISSGIPGALVENPARHGHGLYKQDKQTFVA